MRSPFVATLALMSLAPARALACPGCEPASNRVADAYLWATGLLVLLPLGVVALGWIWLRRAD